MVLLGVVLVGTNVGAAGTSITLMLEPIGPLLGVLKSVNDCKTDVLGIPVHMLSLHGFSQSKCKNSFLLV